MNDRESYKIIIKNDSDFVIDLIIEKNNDLNRKELKIEELEEKIERLNNIIGEIERLIINHNCDTGDIYYKYNGKYLKSELKERIMELVELKENKYEY